MHAWTLSKYVSLSAGVQCVDCDKSISDKLVDATPEELVAHTTVLAQMARFKPEAFEHKSDDIMAFLVKKLLMGRRPKDSVSDDALILSRDLTCARRTWMLMRIGYRMRTFRRYRRRGLSH